MSRRQRPPTRRPYEELWASPTAALVGYRDTEGRPAVAEALLADEDWGRLALRPCPYPGSRHHHPLPMNSTALRQMGRHWDQIVAALRTLRRAHLRVVARATPDLVDLMTVAYAASWLPLYLVFRRRMPLMDGEIPAFVGGLHKASVDVAATLQVLLFESLRTGATVPALTPEGLLTYAERRGFLVGIRGVCAGPPALILEYLGALVDGGPDDEPMIATMSELIGDVTACLRYSRHVVRAALGKYALWAVMYGRPIPPGDVVPELSDAPGRGGEIPGPIGRARLACLRDLDLTERRRFLTALRCVIDDLARPAPATGFRPAAALPDSSGPADDVAHHVRATWPTITQAAAFFSENERAIWRSLGHFAASAPFGARDVAVLVAPLRPLETAPGLAPVGVAAPVADAG